MGTLLTALDSSGLTVAVAEEKEQTLLVGGSTTLPISIVMRVTRTSHTPTRTEVLARDGYYDSFRVGARAEFPNVLQFDWHPTGRLTLAVRLWPTWKWNETERSHIDSRLNGIAAARAIRPKNGGDNQPDHRGHDGRFSAQLHTADARGAEVPCQSVWSGQ